MIFNFLSFLENNTVIVDTHFNAKSWRCQIISEGGTTGMIIGMCMEDVHLLRITDVSLDE